MAAGRSASAWLCIVLVTGVMLVFPATAAARVEAAAVSASSNTTYAPDWFDIFFGTDDSKDLARDVTAKFAAFGSQATTEVHSLDKAPTTWTTPCDEDWFKFQVTADDITGKRGFLIEAFTNDQFCDTFIELYGPGSSFVPSTTPAWGRDDESIRYSDDGPWMYFGSSLSFMPYEVTTTPGWYYFRVRPYSSAGQYYGKGGVYTLRLKKGLLERVYGADRIATAITISTERWRSEGATAATHRAVVIANKDNFPDALSGAVLCGFSSAPLLLTPQSYLPSSVRSEVGRLGAQHVYVLGGYSSVSTAVVSALQSISPTITVVRVMGDTRIQTAVEIALQSRSDAPHFSSGYPTPTVAFIVNRDGWPDALSAVPVSARRNAPILLTPAASLDPDTAEALVHLGTKDVIIVGGTAVVSPAVETSLAAKLGSGHVLRIFGDNRYETAKEVALWSGDLKGPGPRGDGHIGTTASPSVLNALDPTHIGVASGESFPDALAGGAMCGAWGGGPLLLTPKYPTDKYSYIFESYETALPPGDTDYFSDLGGGHTAIQSSRLFGGSAAVSNAMFLELDQFFGFTGP